MPIRLIPVAAGEPIKLDKPVLLIGRNPDCDVILTESRKVSRNHCLIACVDDKLFIRDLGSTNGVWINGHRVEREGRIRPGDELSIADLKYSVRQIDRNGTANGDKADSARKPERKERISSEFDAGGRHVRKVGIDAPIDGDEPVAIPDEDDSFVVEASAPRLPRVRHEEIDIEHHRRRAAAEARPPVDDSDSDSGVLELAEPLNLDMPLDLGDIQSDSADESAGSSSSGDYRQQFDDGSTPDGDLSEEDDLSDAWLGSSSDDDALPPIIPLDD